jgi:putative peptidoglycan lipid II flippase
VRYAMITVLANAVFSLLLIWPLAQAGLALATSLAALLNASLLGVGLVRRKMVSFKPGWGAFCLQLLFACMSMTVVILYFNPGLDEWFVLGNMDRVVMLMKLIFLSLAAYIATLFATGLRVHHILAKAS